MLAHLNIDDGPNNLGDLPHAGHAGGATEGASAVCIANQESSRKVRERHKEDKGLVKEAKVKKSRFLHMTTQHK